jgi:DNA invertase Pin-like site-specific DNA recombinase
MIWGYARVSTDAQSLGNQVAQLTAGDVMIIPTVDRLSRDTTDLMMIARDMRCAGAGLRSLAEPVVDTTDDFAELVLAMLGVRAKLERRRIITARGRADAKGRGVKFGRKPILTPHQQQKARKRIEAGEPKRSFNVSQSTIARLAE